MEELIRELQYAIMMGKPIGPSLIKAHSMNIEIEISPSPVIKTALTIRLTDVRDEQTTKPIRTGSWMIDVEELKQIRS